MFGKNFLLSINFWAVLVFCASSLLSVSAAPLLVKRVDALVPLTPGTPVAPEIVDLFDQYQNLQKQVDEASVGTPVHDTLVKSLAETKAQLDTGLKGVAAIVSAPATSSTPSASASATGSAAPAKTTPAPSASATKAPAVTIVTQLGTTAVVVAQAGKTNTVQLSSGVPKPTPAASKAAGGPSSMMTTTVTTTTTAGPGATAGAANSGGTLVKNAGARLTASSALLSSVVAIAFWISL